MRWKGELHHQKWQLFYRQVLSPLVRQGNLRVRVEIEAVDQTGYSSDTRSSVKAALRELTGDGNVDEG